MSSFIPFLQAATGSAGSASTSSSLIGTLIPFLLIAVIFYFFLIRPQNKKQKETEKMLNALKKGDKVITIGGIHGTVSSVKEKKVISKNAILGAYCFKNKKILVENIKDTIDRLREQNQEWYMSEIFQTMIKNKYVIS